MFLGEKVLVFVKQEGWMKKYPNGRTETAMQHICIIGFHIHVITSAFLSTSKQLQNAIIDYHSSFVGKFIQLAILIDSLR